MTNITPTTEETTLDLPSDGFSDLNKKQAKFKKSLPDMKGIANVFDAYATKKTITTGFLNITLVR